MTIFLKIKQKIKMLFCKHDYTQKYIYEGGYDDYLELTCKKCGKVITDDI